MYPNQAYIYILAVAYVLLLFIYLFIYIFIYLFIIERCTVKKLVTQWAKNLSHWVTSFRHWVTEHLLTLQHWMT